MGATTGIEWTDSTFNPWWGCTKVSAACDFCYAERFDKRTGGSHWGPRAERRRTSEKNWNDPRRWNAQADRFELQHGRPRRVFCASMADVFDNQVPKEWRDDLWRLIRECDRLTWMLLTKRPQNIAKMKPDFWHEIRKYVWLGTTVESKATRDRIRHLWDHECAAHFVSCEPLLGDPGLTEPIHPDDFGSLAYLHMIEWVIAGGETGPGARPSNPQWFRSIRDQCIAADVPFHFKQWGDWNEHGERVGKKRAGRVLDGRTWDEFPLEPVVSLL